MSREPRVGPDVPGSDAPSPDVLDELLRAFSADPDEVARGRTIDLTSPEIAELLTPSGGRPAPDVADPDLVGEPPVESLDGTETSIDDELHPSVGAGPDRTDAPPSVEELAAGAGEEDERDGIEHDETDAGELDETDATVSDESDPGELDVSEGLGRDEGGGVVGDPFLRPAPSASESDEDEEPTGPRTIAIVDEGLPDTVYIGGNLEPTDVGRSTVLIDDRDPDGVTMSLEEAASATKIEPRMRERRIAVKRAQGRKRIKWLVLATVVVALVVAALAVLGSGLFAVDEVDVEGAAQTTDDELAPVIADLEGTPVLLVDTDGVERDLERLPWVEDARVTTQFPNGARIELREREPAATFQGPDGAWRLIDDAGRVLATSAEAPVGFLPITGDGFPDVEPGVFAPSGLQGAARLARSLTPTVAGQAQSIEAAPDGSDLRLTFTDGTEVRFGPATDLVQKLVRLETKLDDLGDEQVNYLDVSTNEVGQG